MTKAKTSLGFGVAECAKRTGLTVRALRLYGRHRLIRPGRTAIGWRCYGPEELRRINVIVTLKALGMTLAQIRSLMETSPPPLAQALELQLQACSTRREAADRAIGLVKNALTGIKSGKTLSLDSLCDLTRSMDMDSSRERIQIIRATINETITPEEERALATWMAGRPSDEVKLMQGAAAAVREVHRGVHELMEKKVDPSVPEVQALIVSLNDLSVRYGLRSFAANLFEWNEALARKWTLMGERAAARIISPRSDPSDGQLMDYMRAAHAASPWKRALGPIVDEAAALADEKAQPSATAAQTLAASLKKICEKHALGEALLYARCARFTECGRPASERKQAAWVFLADAIRAGSGSG